MKASLKIIICAFVLGIITASCSSLKPYERVYVDDPEMKMTDNSGKKFQHYVQSIREGAISVGGKKGSGGCGCN